MKDKKPTGRKIVDAKNNNDGTTKSVLLEGNTNFTSNEKAIEMTKRGLIDAVYVKPSKNAKEYIRTRPDSKTKNNIDELAKD